MAGRVEVRNEMVYLSLGSRILLNAEALNMVESVGNFVRHRRAPIVLPTENGYILRYVPVISGESLAHAYQEILAMIAGKLGLPVCRYCSQGIFVKHSDDTILKDEPWFKKGLSMYDLENNIVKNCIVEDIGGFMYAGKPPTRRTSRFYSGYAIPALDSIISSAVEAQFHVRYDPTSMERQAIYNVEVGSALYEFTFSLDIDGIGVSSYTGEEIVSKEERKKRIEVAIKALGVMINSSLFGAKRTRFNPSWKIVSLAAVISHPIPLSVQPPHSRKYIVETHETLEKALDMLSKGSASIGEKAVLIAYSGDDESVEPREGGRAEVKVVDNPVKVFDEVLTIVNELVG